MAVRMDDPAPALDTRAETAVPLGRRNGGNSRRSFASRVRDGCRERPRIENFRHGGDGADRRSNGGAKKHGLGPARRDFGKLVAGFRKSCLN